MAERVRFEQDGPLGILTLADPPMNLFGKELVGELETRLGEVAEAAPRALVVRADGDVFTAGADVNAFNGLSPDDAREFCGQLIGIAHRLEELPFPTIACVHGLCLTAGFELALA